MLAPTQQICKSFETLAKYIYIYIFLKIEEKKIKKKRREDKENSKSKKECPLWGSNSRPLDAFSVIMRPTLYQLSQGDTNEAIHNPKINWNLWSSTKYLLLLLLLQHVDLFFILLLLFKKITLLFRFENQIKSMCVFNNKNGNKVGAKLGQ